MSTPFSDSIIENSQLVQKFTVGNQAAYHEKLGTIKEAGSIERIHLERKYLNIINDVRDWLSNALENWDCDKGTGPFIPRHMFNQIMTRNVILAIVKTLDPYVGMSADEQEQLSRDIFNGFEKRPPARKLLAMLIGTGAASQLERCLRDGMSDDCLPLLDVYHNDGLACGRHGRHRGVDVDQNNYRIFVQWSRYLTAPYIIYEPDGKHSHYILERGGHLPVVADSHNPPVRQHPWRSDEVMRVTIYRGDRNFPTDQGNLDVFALKKLNTVFGTNISHFFNTEVESLIIASGRGQTQSNDPETRHHLIRLLATFEVYNNPLDITPTYYLLFPWADWNLQDYWEANDGRQSPSDKRHVGWAIYNFYYLAKALQSLQGGRLSPMLGTPIGGNQRQNYQGDITPTSLLIFGESDESRMFTSRVVLTNFGLGGKPSNTTLMTSSYSSPEQPSRHPQSPKAHVFSLGYVLFSHLVWLHKGIGGLRPFLEAFWRSTGSKTAKDSVKSMFSELKGRDDSGETVRELLVFIEDRMLNPDEVTRGDLQEVVEGLGKLWQKWKLEKQPPTPPAPNTDSGYGTAPTTSSKGKGTAQEQLWTIQETIPEDLEIFEKLGLSDDDALTAYTSDSIVDIEGLEYIEEFAQDLLRSFWGNEGNMDPDTVTNTEQVLPQFLKEFAMKIGHNPPTPVHRDIMYFVRKHRHKICHKFREASEKQENDEIQAPSTATPARPGMTDQKPKIPDSVGQMSPADKIFMWRNTTDDGLERQEKQRNQDPDEPSFSDEESLGGGDADERYPTDNPETSGLENVKGYQQYRHYLETSSSYQWLVKTLKKQTLLSRPSPDIRGSIRRRIFRSLTHDDHRVSRKDSSKTHTAVFRMEWDPVSFVEEQEYGIPADEAIASAITITGSGQDTQALSSTQYLEQTWGSSAILRLLQTTIRRGLSADNHHANKLVLEDQTEVAVTFVGQPQVVVVHVQGSIPSIADVGEQLAWIGAALRPSPHDENYMGVWQCSPYIKSLSSELPALSMSDFESAADCVFDIGFRFDKYENRTSNGQCWHGLFRDPVIVCGYPIAKRATQEPATGLEAPLDTLIRLVRADCLTEFDGRTFIKGFSSMLALTERKGDLLLWHLFYDPEGGRISYLEFQDPPDETFLDCDLEACRHVVGWCSNVKIYAGAANGTYDVKKSGLSRPGAGCILEKVSISGGKFVSVSAQLALGVRDTPLIHQNSDYISKIDWISKKFVVLWDEETKRGWLVNGATALLYLVRASLKHDKNGKMKAAFSFDLDEIRESETPHTANSAIDVLILDDNRALKLSKDTIKLSDEGDGGGNVAPKSEITYVLFQHRVENLYHILEKMIDYQVKGESQSGYQMNWKRRSTKYLEGWEFKALATRDDPLYPVVKELPTRAEEWVEFMRDLHAITLFGHGFGDIMLPSSESSSSAGSSTGRTGTTLCKAWLTVPRDRYYLVASLADLKDIMDRNDTPPTPPTTTTTSGKIPADNTLRVSDGFMWHAPRPLFERCQHCHFSSSMPGNDRASWQHADLIQEVLPLATSKDSGNHLKVDKFDISRQVAENQNGAIIFGHSSPRKLRRRGRGDTGEEESQTLSLGEGLESLYELDAGCVPVVCEMDMEMGGSQSGTTTTGSTSGSQVISSRSGVASSSQTTAPLTVNVKEDHASMDTGESSAGTPVMAVEDRDVLPVSLSRNRFGRRSFGYVRRIWKGK